MIKRNRQIKSTFTNFVPSDYTNFKVQKAGASLVDGGIAAVTDYQGTYANLLDDQTSGMSPRWVFFPLIPKGTEDDERIGDSVYVTYFDNKHTMRCVWPNLATTDFHDAARGVVRRRQVVLHLYECIARVPSEAMLSSTSTAYASYFDSTSAEKAGRKLIARFALRVPNQPVPQASIAEPSNQLSSCFIDDVPVNLMFGAKTKKNEQPALVLNDRATFAPGGFKILRHHKIRAPPVSVREVINPDLNNMTDDLYSWPQRENRVRCGIRSRMNTRVVWASDETHLPRTGFCYFQIMYMENPHGLNYAYLPYLELEQGKIRVSWHD